MNQMTQKHHLTSLPFVKSDESGAITSMWSVAPTGDYETDFQTGSDYADMYAQVSGGSPNSALYMISKAMSRSKMGPIEQGFFTRLGHRVQVTR